MNRVFLFFSVSVALAIGFLLFSQPERVSALGCCNVACCNTAAGCAEACKNNNTDVCQNPELMEYCADVGNGCQWMAQCGGTDQCQCSCSCQPVCVNPSSLAFTNPANNSIVKPGDTISWSLGSWGKDTGTNGCGDGCGYLTHSTGQGRFRIFVDGANVSEICAQSAGTGANAVIPEGTSQCTITSVPANWMGTSKTFELRALNNCGNVSVNRTFQFPSNEKPFCEDFNITGGRILNGRLATYPQNFVTINYTGGDSDGYGAPSNMEVCYAVRNQENSFYTSETPNGYRCFPNNQSKRYADLLAGYTGDLPPNSGGFAMDENGFVLVTNTYDNLIPSQFCSTNVGFYAGNGCYYASGCNDTCDGGNCVLNFVNNLPNITAVSPVGNSTTLIGTATDDDNGFSCQDNNPATFTMTVQDADGSIDIDRMEFSLAKPDQLDPGDERYLPLRVMFAKKFTMQGYQEFAANTFFIRDMAVDHNTADRRWCLNQNNQMVEMTTGGGNDNTGWSPNYDDPQNYQNTIGSRSDPNRNVWCYGLDNHTWRDGATATVTEGGVLYDIWYLTQDLTVFGDGYNATLKGGTSWQTSTHVKYARNGTAATASFVIQFNGDEDSKWNGVYHNLWTVRDQVGGFDETANLPGETIVLYGTDTYAHSIGTTMIDFRPPSVSFVPNSNGEQPPVIINAAILELPWEATDNLSGIAAVYGEGLKTGGAYPLDARKIAHNNNYPGQPASWYNPWQISDQPGGQSEFGSPFLWQKSIQGAPLSTSGVEWVNIGDNETGGFRFDAQAVDLACNLSQNPSSTVFDELFSPWLITRAGHVYSGGTLNSMVIRSLSGEQNLCPDGNPGCPEFGSYPYSFPRNHIDLSTEWLASSSNISSDLTINAIRNNLFKSPSYLDANNRSWYEQLNRSAQKRIGREFFTVGTLQPGTLTNVNSSEISGCGSNIPCVAWVDGALNIAPANSERAFYCNNPMIIFANSLSIDGDIRANGAANGCIFVVSGNVTIGAGGYRSGGSSYPRYDLVQAFIIADGSVNIPRVDQGQPMRDGLKVHGGLLAFGSSSFELDRSLQLVDNARYPTYVLHHDTRYFEIASNAFALDRSAIKREVGFKP